MSFSVTYPESAFTSLGSNQVARRRLRAEILADATITPAQILVGIAIADHGEQLPDSTSATGRVWAIVFEGAGPLTGPQNAALDAIIAAHDGADIEPAAPIMGTLGAIPGVIARSLTATSLQDSLGRISATGTLEMFGVAVGASANAATLGHNGGNNERVIIYSRNSSPQGVVTHDATTGNGICIVSGYTNPDVGTWYHFGQFSSNHDWFRLGPPNLFQGFILTRLTASTVSVGVGMLTNQNGKVHALTGTRTLSTATTNNINGTDIGAWAASTIYYIYLLRSISTGTYQIVASTNASTPNLSHANFASDYVAIARISHVRTTTIATTICNFSETGTGAEKTRFIDESTSIWVLLNGGTSTTLTAVSFMTGATSLLMAVTTNATSSANFNLSTGLTVRRSCDTVNAGSAAVLRQTMLNSTGGLAYQNGTGGGATTINVLQYTYGHFSPIAV